MRRTVYWTKERGKRCTICAIVQAVTYYGHCRCMACLVFVNPASPLVALLREIREPIYGPFRALISPNATGRVGLSPGIALLVSAC